MGVQENQFVGQDNLQKMLGEKAVSDVKRPRKWKSKNYFGKSIEVKSNPGGRHAMLSCGEERFYIYLEDAERLRDWLNEFIKWRDAK